MSKHDVMQLAQAFAAALDRGDHAEAAARLAPSCEYQCGGKRHVGPAAIVATYQESWDWVATSLDAVRYESSVRVTGGSSALVTFVDISTHGGEGHTYRCEQLLEFDETGAIARIEHREIAGEREALVAYFARVGVSRG